PVRAGSTLVVAGQAAALRAFNIKDGAVTGTITPGLPASTAAPSVGAFGNKELGTTAAPATAAPPGPEPPTTPASVTAPSGTDAPTVEVTGDRRIASARRDANP